MIQETKQRFSRRTAVWKHTLGKIRTKIIENLLYIEEYILKEINLIVMAKSSPVTY